MDAEYKLSLSPVRTEDAQGAAKDIMEATQAKLGFVPNMYRTMANSPGYLSTYTHGYTQFRESSGFTPQEQEVVFLIISRENDCGYCVAAHSMIADKMSNLDAGSLSAIRSGSDLPDSKLQALAIFTKHVFDTRGMVRKTEASAFLAAGFSEKQIMETVLATAVKTLSNYSNHIFHTDVDDAFASYRLEEMAE